MSTELGAPRPGLPDPLALSLGAGLGFVGIGLGSPGNPHILVRYMSIASARQLRFAALVGTLWNVLMGAGAVLIGMVGRAYMNDVAMLPLADPENVFPVLAQQHLPAVVFGVVVAAIFAAIMSTADSQLLVAASTVVRDVYEKVVRKGEPLGQRTLVVLSRLVVTALVLVALILGWVADELVFWLVLFAWAGLGAALGPTSILALFWPRTTAGGRVRRADRRNAHHLRLVLHTSAQGRAVRADPGVRGGARGHRGRQPADPAAADADAMLRIMKEEDQP
jgi:Na+/proline symporter